MRLLLLPLVVALAACSPAAPEVTVSDAWARATAPGQASAAVYMTIDNSRGGADRLAALSTPAARAASLHGMTMDAGIMRMRPLGEGLAVPAGGRVILGPNGTHVMLSGLKRPLAAGQSIPARLRFERSGERDVVIAVVAAGAR